MACHDEGMALASVVFILALMMVLALVLTDKVLQATRATAAANAREQAISAANAGIEWGRRNLAATYVASDRWQNYLALADGDLKYPAEATFSTSVDGLAVDLFVRDNPDGDDDWRADNDLRVFLLARSRAATGHEAMVEALCGFAAADTAAGYSQRTPGAAEAGPDLAEGPAVEFHLID